jgi:Flp pilus assembly protein TadD
MRSCLLVIALALACDRPADPAPAPTPTAPAKTEAKADEKKAEVATPAKPATPTKPAAPTITKEQRAEYHAHLEEGRKLSKAGSWSEAMEEFDAALDVIPGDDRALGELSWAAFSSGDHAKARETAKAAALAATKPKVKAAALYNLGRAEEASGRIAEAKAAYTESIALRPNKTVSERLAALGKSTPTAPEMDCATPQIEPEVCACLMKSVAEDDAPPECALEPTTNGDIKLATYATSGVGEQRVVVVVKQPTGWSVAAELATVYNPGMAGINEELQIGGVTSRSLGSRTIVEITASKSRSDTDLGIDEIESEDSELLVVCVIGDATTPTTCPLQLVTSHVYERDRLGMADEGEEIDKSLQTPGLPIRETTRIDVEYTDDGVAKLRATEGKVDADELGDRKLW